MKHQLNSDTEDPLGAVSKQRIRGMIRHLALTKTEGQRPTLMLHRH